MRVDSAGVLWSGGPDLGRGEVEKGRFSGSFDIAMIELSLELTGRW